MGPKNTRLLSRPTSPGLAAACALLFALPTTAQELKELRLKDGRVLVGKVQSRDGTFEVETREGNVSVQEKDVARLRTKVELQQALKDKAKQSGDSAFAHVNLARVARDYGLENDMWRHLDKAVEALGTDERGAHDEGQGRTAQPTAVERRLHEFLAQLEPELLPRSLRQAPTSKRVQAMLRECHAGTKPGKHEALVELLVREPNADQLPREHARRNGNFRQRIAALSALQRRRTNGNDHFVLRTTVLDRDKKVREAAAELGRPTVGEQDITYMASGLAHSNAKVRVRTAEAMGALGHPAAIDLLVKAGPYAAAGLAASNDTGATRGHIAFLQQQAYIRDFDVEVAQASFIADPKVDVLQSGSVLDVTVAGVVEVRTIVRSYRDALRQLTSSDPGDDPREWPTWRAKLLEKVEAPITGKR